MSIGADIAERLLEFGLAVLKLADVLPRGPAGRHVALQWVRSATGAGSNYEEARAAESRNDFIHKLGIAEKEIRESHYWTSLVRRSGWVQKDLGPLNEEARQLAAILGASGRTARSRTSE
jgi:four helix bundle protein